MNAQRLCITLCHNRVAYHRHLLQLRGGTRIASIASRIPHTIPLKYNWSSQARLFSSLVEGISCVIPFRSLQRTEILRRKSERHGCERQGRQAYHQSHPVHRFPQDEVTAAESMATGKERSSFEPIRETPVHDGSRGEKEKKFRVKRRGGGGESGVEQGGGAARRGKNRVDKNGVPYENHFAAWGVEVGEWRTVRVPPQQSPLVCTLKPSSHFHQQLCFEAESVI